MEDKETISAATYLMMRRVKICYDPLSNDDPTPWEVGHDLLSSDQVRALASSKGWTAQRGRGGVMGYSERL
jgi:hypothetical protein